MFTDDSMFAHYLKHWPLIKVGTAEKVLKARKQNGAFWRYLKRCFGSWNCWEKCESKEAKWCILAIFETVFWKLELFRTF